MLVLRPKGRGNWAPVFVSLEDQRISSLLIRRGQEITLGGIVWRIAKVMP
jgi:hypothetical protein